MVVMVRPLSKEPNRYTMPAPNSTTSAKQVRAILFPQLARFFWGRPLEISRLCLPEERRREAARSSSMARWSARRFAGEE